MSSRDTDKLLMLLMEIREIQKEILKRQDEILMNVREIKKEQSKLWEELQMSRFVLEQMNTGPALLN